MSLSDAAETDLMELLFQNANWTVIGSGGLSGSGTAGVFWVSLHTANPGEAGVQTTSEANYGSYGRVSVARSSGAGGWTIAAGQVSNTSAIQFPACSSGSSTVTYVGLGTDQNGAGNLIASHQITNPAAGLQVSTGITPQFASGALIFTVD
jgi:hypothetical protein